MVEGQAMQWLMVVGVAMHVSMDTASQSAPEWRDRRTAFGHAMAVAGTGVTGWACADAGAHVAAALGPFRASLLGWLTLLVLGLWTLSHAFCTEARRSMDSRPTSPETTEAPPTQFDRWMILTLAQGLDAVLTGLSLGLLHIAPTVSALTIGLGQAGAGLLTRWRPAAPSLCLLRQTLQANAGGLLVFLSLLWFGSHGWLF
ncbi:hypothetical protein GCM10025857_16990 [Alicyclobacillus contaminans]|uniref:manganese efflux pump n=1 Tax=Alicyclobacillus contaminans TaxID=392016 RepID=UPI0004223256|nr:manganese efflux pump [Alicyclobacillus contaminans]GMA50342.1 hypothetical protein GCM10025857_16990 [Alicyclobacillus contaminans]